LFQTGVLDQFARAPAEIAGSRLSNRDCHGQAPIRAERPKSTFGEQPSDAISRMNTLVSPRPLDRLDRYWRPLEVTLRAAARAWTPALVQGLRLLASVCLALYVAFWLQLDNAYWAGASAAAVCQTTLGASLRKGWYRMLGTVVGAFVIVVLTGCFVQNRLAFLVAIAVWAALCAVTSTLLRNFAAYGAALASATAIIIAGDSLGATGGPDGQTFILAVTRASEICIGIVCSGLVLAATDFGGARYRLAAQFQALLSEVVAGITTTLSAAGAQNMRSIRRALLGRIAALDPSIETTIGESSEVRYRSPVLARAVDGLLNASVGWQTIDSHLECLSPQQAQEQLAMVQGYVGPALRALGRPPESVSYFSLHRMVLKSARRLVSTPAPTPSVRLLLDQAARILAGLSSTLTGMMLLVENPERPPSRGDPARPHVADWLPGVVNGGRALLTIGAAMIFWVTTGWPSGASCIVWAAIPVVLFGPRSDAAFTTAVSFLVGATIGAVCASVVKFALLPQCDSFAGLCAVLACFLIPVGALGARSRLTALFGVLPTAFVALVSPANVMIYDTISFYNAAAALVAGAGIAALSFLLLPPLSPALRTRRVMASTLRDLRRIAAGDRPRSPREWKRKIYARLIALPDSAEPVRRAELSATVAMATELIRLQRATAGLPIEPHSKRALAAVAGGCCEEAKEDFARLDLALAGAHDGVQVRRARASIVVVTELLRRHSSYFCEEPDHGTR
jgi:uncharacterized membrane protein YccC